LRADAAVGDEKELCDGAKEAAEGAERAELFGGGFLEEREPQAGDEAAKWADESVPATGNDFGHDLQQLCCERQVLQVLWSQQGLGWALLQGLTTRRSRP
jgi:hypothetical protein